MSQDSRRSRFCWTTIGRRFAGVVAVALLLAAGAVGRAEAASTPWTALKTYKDNGVLRGDDGSGGKQDATAYDYQIAVYLMDDGGNTSADWYRIDMALSSGIQNYRKGNNVCGWWTDAVDAAFDLETKGGQIEEYAPTTGQSAKERSFSVGGMSVSQSYPDAGIKANRDGPAESIRWSSNFKGCSCKRIPGYIPVDDCSGGASSIAKSTFTLYPTVLVKVPEGQGLKFNTYVGDFDTRAGAKKYYSGRKETVRKKYKMTVTCSTTACSIK
ncbi:MAG: hypothetical protein GC201_08035 [Alphaproteobacteria bacterium]|nr:hypothetical protein [Alphaproteobacteria bacterium]